jgi:hypothetical protein
MMSGTRVQPRPMLTVLHTFRWACVLATIITLHHAAGWVMRIWPDWRSALPGVAITWLGQLIIVWLCLTVIQSTAPRLPRWGPDRIARIAMLVVFCSVLAFASQAVLALLIDGDWTRNAMIMFVWQLCFSTLLVLAYLAVEDKQLTEALEHADALKALALDRDLSAARLAVLQAQVEPHFVFNALANARWLLRTDAAAARALLDDLLRYFEEALPALRADATTLAREMELARAYLAIHQVRMGARLAFDVRYGEDLAGTNLPPMLLITLVENALKHGLRPLVEGGHVDVFAVAEHGQLIIQVADTGRGMSEGSGHGTGLANIRARLKAVYGDSARLTLAVNQPRGVIATLNLPIRHTWDQRA